MSQAGLIDVVSSNPDIPTTFITNSGSAVPIANTLDILGTTVANHGIPLETLGSGNTVTIEAQYAAANATSDATKAGFSSFNSTEFTVDANGFVSLAGSGPAIGSFAMQTGTSPVTPNGSGIVTFNGSSVVAGTNPVRTNGTGANTMQLEVQTSQSIAAADATKIGLCNFDSSSFSVTATGFVTLATGGVGKTITGNSGGALSPTANNWNILGSGSITTSGSVSTLTVQLTGLTNHSLLVGAGTSTITKVGPSATSGQVLQSQGASADPAFSTATYPSTATSTGTILRSDGTNWVATTATYPNTTTINQILYSSASNTIGGITAANSAVLVSNSTGVPAWSSTMTNGQVIIGSTGSTPSAATLTAGSGISITNGAGSITITATSGGFAWTDVTTSTQTLVAENGYITDRSLGVTYTLPASGTLGDIIKIVGKLGLATITPNANQQILIGSASGTVGITGTAVSNNAGDCIELVCITAGASSVWRSSSVIGTWTLN